MRMRILAVAVACAAGLWGQHRRFSWQDACFKNPAAPYCPGHDFAVKPSPPAKDGAPRSVGAGQDSIPAAPQPATPSVIVVGGIDWRFADPSADSLAGFNAGKLPASPLTRAVIAQLGATLDLAEADLQKISLGLAGVYQMALSVRDKRVVIMVTGRAAGQNISALEPGWKSVRVAGNALLLGHADAVDLAVQRIGSQGQRSELTGLAEDFQAGSNFWALQTAPDPVRPELKRCSLALSIRDRLDSDLACEFAGVPDANALRIGSGGFIEGNQIHFRTSIEAHALQDEFSQITDSPLGARLATLVNAAQYLAVRETPVTGPARPVIHGLDDGPKEVNPKP